MLRTLACSLWISTALAQAPPPDPMAEAIQAVLSSRQNSGRMDPSLRDAARAALAQAPVDSPNFGRWSQTVAQFYGNSLQARQVLEQSLARTGPPENANPSRRALLTSLAEWWMQDRNLLRALPYAEQSLASGPSKAETAAAAGQQRIVAMANNVARMRVGSPGFGFQRLLDLYRQLGRPHDVEAIVGRLEATGADDTVLEQIYERQGQFDKAEAIFKRQVENAGDDPQRTIGALQTLSSFYSRTDRVKDAISTLEKAISAAADNTPYAAQRFWLRQELASLLARSGRTEEADSVYQQLLGEARALQGNVYNQALSAYANFLADHRRGDEAEGMLQRYVDSTPLQPWEKANTMYAMAGVAQRSGNGERAQEYRSAASAIQDAQSKTMALPTGFTVSKLIQDANTAANSRKFDEAYALTIEAIAAAPAARDGFTVAFMASNIAVQFASHKEELRAQQIFDRLLASLDAITDDPNEAEQVYRNYERMCVLAKRWDDAGRVLERFRDVVVSTHGPETGRLDQYYRSKVDLAKSREALQEAASAANEYLNYQVGLSGDTSEAYLSAMQFAAPVLEKAGRVNDAVALYRREAKVVDLTTDTGDRRRAAVRAEASLGLARAGQFEEAEDLARQAAQLSESYRRNLQTVLQMRTAAAKR